jgi:hypothetical protein
MEIKEKFTEATPAVIQKIANEKKHYVSDKEYENFRYYSDNVYPKKLIDERRPNEQAESKDYRALMYQPVFSETFNKVFQSLSKINRADGFFIKYPDMSAFTKINEDERLDRYLHDLPKWLFNICLKQYLIDANAVCLIWANPDEDNTKYAEPKPYIINTNLVMYYDDDLLVYKSKDEDYTYYSVDKFNLIKWKRNKQSKYYADVTIPNGAKELTAFKLGGVFKGQDGVYESRIASMLPWLNVATVEFSDLCIEITLHIHSQQWVYENEECGVCKGLGSISVKGEKVKCTNSKCNSGYIPRGPMEVIKVRGGKTNLGEVAAPMPPGGYIEKNVEIAKLQSERIKEQALAALSAINMEFLSKTPITQSGVAKSYDMDETNNLFYSVATDLARIIKEVAEYTALWRYGFLYPEEEERLDRYLHDLPKWLFNICLKQYLIDANAVCLIWANPDEDNTKYAEPKPYIINTNLVMYYDDDLLVYKSKDEDYTYYSVDKFNLIKWKRNKQSKYYADVTIPNGAKELTAFKLGGVFKGQDGVYESRIASMLPWLNVATVEFSDLCIEITLHIHSQQWVYENEECGVCKGLGSISVKGEKVKCTNSKCNSGYIPRGPMEVIKVRGGKTNLGEVAAPMPPGGYIEKNVEIAKLQSERIKEQALAALSAINMEFLSKTPITQSGVAKSYDMDETNNLFYSVATDLARIIKEVAEYTALWRYGFLYPEEEEREAMLPTVILPNTFDIVSAQFLVDEIKAAKDSGLNDAVLSEMEIEYIKKRFPNDIDMQNKMIAAFNLSPASGKNAEQMGYLIANRMMSKADGLISTYIYDFIDRAIVENKDFYTLEKSKQMEIMYNYATEKEKQITLRDQLVKTV